MMIKVFEKNCSISGKKVFYLEQPEGMNTILFLHGKTYNSGDWLKLNRTIEALHDLQYKFYAVDFPGFGRSEKNNLDPVDFIDAFITEIQLNDFVLVGPSMSGGFALKYALKYPAHLKGLVTMAPAWIENEIEHFSEIEIPVLLMSGEEDKIVNPEIVKKLHKVIPDSEFHLFKGLGHPFYFEDEELFKNHLIEFLLFNNLLGNALL